MDWFGSDAFGQVLEPGRVGDCYLGLLLPPPLAGEPEAGRVLVVAPRALLHPTSPNPPAAGSTSCSPAIPTANPTSWCSSLT
jgi:hypothetical protein